MKRFIYKDLLKWKDNEINKPLLLLCARQVGKTYLVNEFINKEFSDSISINLLKNSKAKKLLQSKKTYDNFIHKLLNKI